MIISPKKKVIKPNILNFKKTELSSLIQQGIPELRKSGCSDQFICEMLLYDPRNLELQSEGHMIKQEVVVDDPEPPNSKSEVFDQYATIFNQPY